MGWFSKKKEDIPAPVVNVVNINITDWDNYKIGYYDDKITISKTEMDVLHSKYKEIKEAEQLKERISKLYTDAYVFYQKELAQEIAGGKHILKHIDGVVYGYSERNNKVYVWDDDSQVIYTKVTDSSIIRGQFVPQLSGVWIENRRIPKEVYEYFINEVKCK